MKISGPSDIDFGKKGIGSEIVAKFDLVNDFYTDVIVSMLPNCGCIDPTIHYKGAVLTGNKIPAGEPFSVTVKYDSYRLGFFEKTLQVDTTDTFGKLEARVLLTLKGTVE